MSMTMISLSLLVLNITQYMLKKNKHIDYWFLLEILSAFSENELLTLSLLL